MPEMSVVDYGLDFTLKYYMIESVDSILDVFGNDCIIRGCEITNLNFISETKLLKFEITPGLVIADRKLIKFPEIIPMEIDMSNLNITGKLAVLVSYRYLRTSRPNLAVISIKYVDENNHCDNWWEELDKVILSIIDYNISTVKFSKYESNYLEDKKIMINNIERTSRKFDYLTSNLRDIYSKLIDELGLLINLNNNNNIFNISNNP